MVNVTTEPLCCKNSRPPQPVGGVVVSIPYNGTVDDVRTPGCTSAAAVFDSTVLLWMG